MARDTRKQVHSSPADPRPEYIAVYNRVEDIRHPQRNIILTCSACDGEPEARDNCVTHRALSTDASLLDEIINTVNELVFKAVDRLEEALSNAPADLLGYVLPAADAAGLDESSHEAALTDFKQKEIDIGIMQLESLLNAIVDKDFDKLEIYTLRNILAVGHADDSDLARWIRLEHYQDLNIDPGAQQITPEMIQLQRRKRHETAKLNLMLKEEHVKNAAIIEQLQSTIIQNESSPLGFVAFGSSSVRTSQDMEQILARLPMLQQCLANLKTAIAQPAVAVRASDDSSMMRRRKYLAQQSLKALEVHGLTVQKPDQLVASRLPANRDEVEGLEAIVQALGTADGVPD
ncbi:hypothetical protein AMS68_001785 [Peltaster fructicola]|uniref:Mis12 domain-containing protein n=1 Tax=Peltaster fructicola TaxID=286661 RepID=A0A6H0XNR8_9PEZI|nr:hypothetical protein AMS68_001785 [Peltaster fructicola]